MKTKQSKAKKIDGKNSDGSGWLYSDIVKDHFFNPRNFMRYGEEKKFKHSAMGKSGSPACGDEMVMWLKIDPKTKKITECRWRTFGCGSAIASTSVLSEIITENGGMKIDEAKKIKPALILKRLGGLPARKIHCSILGDKALENAIENWTKKHKRRS